MDQMYYDCFTTHLVDNGNVEMSYEKFDDIYSAMIYAYKKSFVKFLANVPNKNQMYPGYQYRSVIRRFTMVFYDEVYHPFPKFENIACSPKQKNNEWARSNCGGSATSTNNFSLAVADSFGFSFLKCASPKPSF